MCKLLTLKLARRIANQLQPVSRGVRLEIGSWGPGVFAIIRRLLDDREQWVDILGRSTQEQDRDGAIAGRLPGDGVWLADGNDLVQCRLGDWVAGRACRGFGVGVDGREAGHEEGEGGEFGWHFSLLFSFYYSLNKKENQVSFFDSFTRI